MNGDNGVLEGKAIYITGSRHLDNEALARFLVQETGVRCEAVSFEQMDDLSRQIHSTEARLFLIDALGWRIREMVKVPPVNESVLSTLFSLLFQDGHNGGAPEKPSPGGLCGFFYRCDSADHFLLALRGLFTDRKSLPEGPPVRYMRSSTGHEHEEGHPLSPREFHILFLMAGGLNNKDIAARLNISGHTVRTHLYNIFRKIHVRNRVQASLWVHAHVERFFCAI